MNNEKETTTGQIHGRWRVKRSIVYIAIGFSPLLPGLPQRALAQIPSAETSAVPAAASLNGVVYVAWKGRNTQDSIWYSSGGPGDWSSQTEIGFAKTTQAPALATDGSNVYLAWRGESLNTTDNVFWLRLDLTKPHPQAVAMRASPAPPLRSAWLRSGSGCAR
jgi:hypothetical protein